MKAFMYLKKSNLMTQLKFLENLDENNKNDILSQFSLDRFVLLESLSYPEDSAANNAARVTQCKQLVCWSNNRLFRENRDLKEFLEIFIVDNEFKPIEQSHHPKF